MTYSDYRLQARESLRGNWGIAVGVTILAALLGGLIVNTGQLNLKLDQHDLERFPPNMWEFLALIGSFGGAVNLLHLILGGPVCLGYCRFLLKLCNGEAVGTDDLFSQFHRFKDSFCLRLLTRLFIALWSLLFIIPGIIASYRYAMAPFIMAENEGITALEALKASKEMMYGHKGELFTLGLTFIGWSILSIFTLGIGFLFLNPYINAAYAAFYRDLRDQQRRSQADTYQNRYAQFDM